jgi:hypothetical protein
MQCGSSEMSFKLSGPEVAIWQTHPVLSKNEAGRVNFCIFRG